MRGLLTAVLAFACLCSAPASAKNMGSECNVSIDPSSRIVRMFYDPFESDLAVAFLTVVITNAGDDKCQLALSLEGRGSRTQRELVAGGSRLRYEVARDGLLVENQIGIP